MLLKMKPNLRNVKTPVINLIFLNIFEIKFIGVLWN